MTINESLLSYSETLCHCLVNQHAFLGPSLGPSCCPSASKFSVGVLFRTLGRLSVRAATDRKENLEVS